MIRFEDALRLVFENTNPIKESEEISYSESLGRVFSTDIYAPCDIPHFDNSAMDGYALFSIDTKDASHDNPLILKIIGEIKAGNYPEITVKRGTAIRIMTGAFIPSGADSVVMFENTEENGKGELKIFSESKVGENIRKKGEDVKQGEIIIKKGKKIRPYEIGMLASLGIKKIKVYKKPKVAILITGDEILNIDDKLPLGKIRDSNGPMLFASLLRIGIKPINLGSTGDKFDNLNDKVLEALDKNSDVLLISGGVSEGRYDLVKDVLIKFGLEEIFHKVAIKPGKPLLFGKINNTLIFGLPGNPVSLAITFQVFVKPSLLKMMHENINDSTISAVLSEDIKKKPGRTHFVRVVLEKKGDILYANPLKKQGSAMISSLINADGFIKIEASETFIKKREKLKVRPLY